MERNYQTQRNLTGKILKLGGISSITSRESVQNGRFGAGAFILHSNLVPQDVRKGHILREYDHNCPKLWGRLNILELYWHTYERICPGGSQCSQNHYGCSPSWDLHNNKLTGPIPPQMGWMMHLNTLCGPSSSFLYQYCPVLDLILIARSRGLSCNCGGLNDCPFGVSTLMNMLMPLLV